MTSLLAIETSTDACSVAICHNNITRETFVIRPREHNRIVLTMLYELLKGLNVTFADLDAIAFGAGPGSFTGLRLSAGIVQGLAFSTQKPVIPVSSLAALALSAGEQMNTPSALTLLTIVDARMQDVYFSAYQYEPGAYGSGQLLALADDELLPVSQLSARMARYQDAIIIGGGCPAELMPPSATPFALPVYPKAKAVLALAKLQFDAGQTLSAEQAMPVYLRESVSWQKWQPKSALKAPPTV
jgi:tRNA threonylcarbamoyladenosine biosynthesis protein TsaB